VEPGALQSLDGADHIFSAIIMLETTERNRIGNSLGNSPEADILSARLNERTTGFMVSPCYALTIYKGVAGGNAAENAADVLVRFSAKLDESGNFASGTALPVFWGGNEGAPSSLNDWMLLKISACVGKVTGWFNLTPYDPASQTGPTFDAVAYFANSGIGTLRTQEKCVVALVNRAQITWHSSCQARPGVSGAPVFHRDGSSVPDVVGLLNGLPPGSEISELHLGFGTMITPIENVVPWVHDIIGEDIRAWGEENPGARTQDAVTHVD
jgi:hypothetical protein